MKRLLKNKEEELEEITKPKTKAQKKKAIWKQVNKKLILKVCRNEASSIIGDPCHRSIMIPPTRFHNNYPSGWDYLESKHSNKIKLAFKGFSVDEALSYCDSLNY